MVLLQCLGRGRRVADDVIVGFGPPPDDIGQDLLVVIVVVGPRYPAADNRRLRREAEGDPAAPTIPGSFRLIAPARQGCAVL